MTDQPKQADRFDIVGVRLVWPQVLRAVRDVSRATAALLDNATLTAANDNTVRLTLPTASMVRQLNNDNNRKVIEWALRNSTAGVDWKVVFELANDHAASTRSPEEESSSSDSLTVGDASCFAQVNGRRQQLVVVPLEHADYAARALALAALAQNPTGKAIHESVQFMSTSALYDLSTLACNLADQCDELIERRTQSEPKTQGWHWI
jgi:hypothetical protein